MTRGYDLADETQVREFLRDVETEYQFQCLHEKQADGCHRLAEFRETIKQDVASAGPLYKENCDKNNYSKSCFSYGQCLLTGKGVPEKKPDLTSALKYYEKSCDMDSSKGCFVSALLRLSSDVGAEKNTEKAIVHLSKACSLKDGEACFKLSSLYLTGNLVAKDLNQAYQLAKAGCELDHFMACNNLSLMYRHGHGTEKNLVMASKAKEKAMNLSAEEAMKRPSVIMNR
ncbi:unnamed protein product [Candidula unifasciata]|uniref:Cytochrome c oxidase assembly factor 7 n=1 Tax=Candidula unifasciata TaxID=100452 RepID=A0A8S3ZYB0_9EUPU|nr:unnamed protein product [Candidula unifasciata]